jgi:hypothetical protein
MRVKAVREGKSLDESTRGSGWIGVVRDACSHGKEETRNYCYRLLVDITWNVVPLYGLQTAVLEVDNSSRSSQLCANRPRGNIPSNRSNQSAEATLVVLELQVPGMTFTIEEFWIGMPCV